MGSIRHWLWITIVAVFIGLIAAACKSEPSEAAGGLVLIVETDLAIPQDLDHVDVVATREGEAKPLLDTHASLGQGEGKIALPTKLEIRAPRGAPVRIQAIGRKNGQARIVRDAVTSLPSSGTRQLKLSLVWLCDNTAVETQPGGAVRSTCAQTDPLTCIEGVCAPELVPADDLKPVDAASGGASGSCFDAHQCFASSTELALDPNDCSVEAPAGATATNLNLALRTPPSATCSALNGGDPSRRDDTRLRS